MIKPVLFLRAATKASRIVGRTRQHKEQSGKCVSFGVLGFLCYGDWGVIKAHLLNKERVLNMQDGAWCLRISICPLWCKNVSSKVLILHTHILIVSIAMTRIFFEIHEISDCLFKHLNSKGNKGDY